jgi:hypothetical protein
MIFRGLAARMPRGFRLACSFLLAAAGSFEERPAVE